ncbi:hypothetical protein PR002_g11331 [Phytophthora rubi]|uniref:Uncharacterized protein n=1 Tax=Phytophthora rubi TaxID=129364 RepID=A0A6A3M3R0_9STRA|nr:hypothetical protein PR002_g11331 [Phytophthora rubi]
MVASGYQLKLLDYSSDSTLLLIVGPKATMAEHLRRMFAIEHGHGLPSPVPVVLAFEGGASSPGLVVKR